MLENRLDYGENYYSDRVNGSGQFHYEKRSKILFSRLKDFDVSDSGKLLDIGCALGEFLKIAKLKGYEPFGAEVSDFAADKARNDLKAKIYNVDIQSGPLPENENKFDIITMFDVIEHMKRPFEALLEANRLLRPAGKIVIVTSNPQSLARYIKGKKWVGLKDVTHTHLFTPYTLKFILNRTGFKNIKTKTYLVSTTEENLVTNFINMLFDVARFGGQLWAVAEK